MKKQYDVIIVGTGAAGCFAALHLPTETEILMITKAAPEESDSFLAQGGICVMKNENDYDSFFEDTLHAGHYENSRESVDIMIRSSREVIDELIDYGVDFAMENGELLYTKEGAHSTSRILYHEDITGQEITSKLLDHVKKLPNVTLLTQTAMIDILAKDNRCDGILMRLADGKIVPVYADNVIWACGGIGGIYENSTNYPHLTGDALAISLRRGVKLKNMNYVQIHPTTLYSEDPGRRFLISESVRGEGAILYNKKGGHRFVDELQPRDVVSKAIHQQMELDGTKYVWLSMENIPEKTILEHFPNIYQHCLEEGYDVTKEPIPVVPSQHYFMGGVDVDLQSRTSMDHLYAAGETSCNGVHGANRLASNSLLESLVFAKRAAQAITENRTAAAAGFLKSTDAATAQTEKPESIDEIYARYDIHPEEYQDTDQYETRCKERIWEEIKREEQHGSHYQKIEHRSPAAASTAGRHIL